MKIWQEQLSVFRKPYRTVVCQLLKQDSPCILDARRGFERDGGCCYAQRGLRKLPIAALGENAASQ